MAQHFGANAWKACAMLAPQVAADVVGIALILLVLNDVFQSVIVPRAVGRTFRFSYLLWRGLWRIWPELALRIHRSNATAREDFLAVFAPLTLVLQLVMWSFIMLTGFGLLFFSSAQQIQPRLHTFFEAFYFAGTSFFTIGFGDFVGRSGWTRLLALAAGASGFGVVGTTTAFLFAIFGSFQAREQFVVLTGARAGNPPNGVGLLVIASQAGTRDSLPLVMANAQSWCALIMETHLAYPSLAYFRSSHDEQSWVGTLGTLLDAATLMMTTVQCDPGEARILYEIGRHAAVDLAHYFRVAAPRRDPGISRDEFEHACSKLERAGYALHNRETAWERFGSLRTGYASDLNALARFFAIPPLQWIGDRSILPMPTHGIENR